MLIPPNEEVIELRPDELRLAVEVGWARHMQTNPKAEAKGTQFVQNNWEKGGSDFMGAKAELATAIWFKIPWDQPVGDRKAVDLTFMEVRSSARRATGIIIAKAFLEDHRFPYPMVYCESQPNRTDPRVTLLGWQWPPVFCQPAYEDTTKTGAGWRCPIDKLDPLEELYAIRGDWLGPNGLPLPRWTREGITVHAWDFLRAFQKKHRVRPLFEVVA